jgi:hypothetical protein
MRSHQSVAINIGQVTQIAREFFNRIGQDQPFMADSSLASRPDAEALAQVARSNAVV